MLRFHARPGHCVRYPERRAAGQLYNFIGRKYDATTRDNAATDEPFEIDEAHADDDTRKAARHLMTKCRDGDLLPADEATARACGVAFEPLAKVADGWAPKPAASPAKASKQSAKD
jgi:hypothetical protein